MNTAQALQTAAGRVHVIHLGRDQWQVNSWSTQHNAWYCGNICNRVRAMHEAWEDKVHIALQLLGVEDAGYIASMAVEKDYPTDWRTCVRQEVRRARLVADA